MSHGDRLEALPPGFVSIAHSGNSPYAVMADPARGYYGLQFHPEVIHTPRGTDRGIRIHRKNGVYVPAKSV